MKVKLKAVLRTTDTLFEPFQQNQFVFQAGNTLTIKQFFKPSCQFIHLTKQLTHLYSFKPTPNKKACFVAEKLIQDKIHISHYSLKKQRKTVCLSDSPQFFPSNIVDNVQLLVDQFDSFLVYGYAKAGNDNCIFLVDFNKLKIVSIGYVAAFNDIKVNTKQNLTLTLCYGNAVRTAHVYNGFWQTDQKIYKKIGNANIIKHQSLSGDITLLCSKNQMFFMQEHEIIQTIQVIQNNEDQIRQVIKLTKGILVLSKKQKIKIYIEDHDELTYIFKGFIKINLKENQKISRLVISANCEQVLLRTNKNEVFIWKVQDLQAHNQITYQFQKVQNATIYQSKGTVSLASGKQTALLAGQNGLLLWDLQKNGLVLQTNFNRIDQNSEKAIYTASLNPDGNSLICAFQDKVKIFKILLKKLRFIAEFSIKKCSQLLYSHGGQYVACKYGKGANSTITVLNTLRMSEIATFKTHAEPVFIVWNQMDDQLIVSTDNYQITTFKLSETSKSYSVKIPQKINMVRLDYITKRLLVSTDTKIYIVDHDKTQKIIEPKVPKFNFIFPLHGIYFSATKDGSLYWSNLINFETFHEIPVFINKPFNLVYRNGYMLAYNSFENITIIECQRHNIPAKKQLLKTSQDIVFVERDQINKFFQKITNIQSNLQALQLTTSQRLEQQKLKYDLALQQNSQKFTEQISYLQKRFQQINNQKLKQQKQNNRVFQQLQGGQIKSVNDLEKMYDRKLRLQKQKGMDLEQKNVEQKVHYEKVIYQLEKRYHDDISKIREQYSTKLTEEFKRLEDLKKNDIDYKKKMEYKLIALEEESQITVFEVQKMKDEQIKQLRRRILQEQNKSNTNKVQFHNQLNRYKKIQAKFTTVQEDLKKHKLKLAEAYERIKLLQTQVDTKNRMVQERNNVIAQHQHQIGGLQKAKYVLSFRTTQIRKELQPKESLIDKLKSQMFKLDEEFKQQKQKAYFLSQKLQKVDKLNKILKQQNIQLNLKLKNRERTHEEMSGQIFTIVNQMDQKQWPSALVKVYQNYIKEQHFKNMKKKSKDATSEQINRHLIHLQQSLQQVTAGNQKILKGKDLDAKRKMKQNADLIFDFNQLKKKYALKIKQIDQEKLKVSKLEQQIHQSNKTSTRANTAKTGTRRPSRERVLQKGDAANFDLSFKRDSEIYFQKRDIATRQSRSRASSSGYRTMILRSDKKQNSRLFDLAKDLENSKYTIKKQQKMIQELNQRLLQQDIN